MIKIKFGGKIHLANAPQSYTTICGLRLNGVAAANYNLPDLTGKECARCLEKESLAKKGTPSK